MTTAIGELTLIIRKNNRHNLKHPHILPKNKPKKKLILAEEEEEEGAEADKMMFRNKKRRKNRKKTAIQFPQDKQVKANRVFLQRKNRVYKNHPHRLK